MPRLEPVDYDPFAAKPPPRLEPVDYDPFTAQPQSTAPVPSGQESVPLPRPRPAEAPQPPVETVASAPIGAATVLGTDEPMVGPKVPVPDVAPLDDVKPRSKPWALSRGFWTGMTDQNPELAAQTLEGMAHLAPESFKETLMNASKNVNELRSVSPDYKPEAKSMWNVRNRAEALTWAGETIGQGLSSSVPSIALGLAGAAIGGATSGPVGATVGGVGGAAVPSAGLNYGEVYKALKDEKVDPKEAAKWAAAATVPITMLDMASLGPIIGKLGFGAVRQELARGIAKRVAVEIAKGSGREGITEAMQEGIKDATVSMKSDKKFFTPETAMGIIESGVGGALTGGVMSAPAGIPGGKTRTTNVGPDGVPIPEGAGVTPEQIQQQVAAAGVTGLINTPADPPPPGGPMTVNVGGTPTTVQTDPVSPPGTVPPTVVPSEDGVVTTVAVDPGVGVHPTVTSEVGSVPNVEPTAEVKADTIGSAPAEGFYSRVFNYVQEKGPTRATAQRWMAWVRRGEFTQEEVNDLGLNNYLKGIGPREKITKQDVLAHLDQNAITLEEIERRPLSDNERDQKREEIWMNLQGAAQGDPSMVQPLGTTWQYNQEHPVVTQAMAQLNQLDDIANWTQYERWTTPGRREAYVELTMHTPKRITQAVQETIPEPQGEVRYDPHGDPRYPWVAIVNGHEFNRTTREEVAHGELEEGLALARQNNNKGFREFTGSHYGVPGELFTMRVTIRRTKQGQPMAVLEELQSDIQQRAKKVGVLKPNPSYGYVPSLPFKQSWQALGFNRFLMWAAERGIRHVAWASAAEQMRRYPGGTTKEEQIRRRGMEQFYDREMLGMAKKWQKRVGATLGYQEVGGSKYTIQPGRPGGAAFEIIDVNNPGPRPAGIAYSYENAQEFVARNQDPPTMFRALTIPETGIDYIAQGMPTHAKEPVPTQGTVEVETSSGVSPLAIQQAEPLRKALEDMIRQLNVNVPITVKLMGNSVTKPVRYKTGQKAGQLYERVIPNAAGVAISWGNSKHEIRIAVGQHKTQANLWATMVHELGHIIDKTSYQQAPLAVRQAVDAAFDKYLASLGPTPTVGDMIRGRQNYINILDDPAWSIHNTIPMTQLSPSQQAYHLSKSEWFAEQVAKWGTSKVKPLSTVEKFFKGVGRKMLEMFNIAVVKYQLPAASGVEALHEWLDTQIEGDPTFYQDVMAETQNEGTVANAGQMEPEDTPAPQQPETLGGMDGINGIFNGNPPPDVRQGRAYADRFTWLHKWMMGVHQVAEQNPHIAPLAEYVETLRVASQIKQQIMIRAQEVWRKWNALGDKEGDAVAEYGLSNGCGDRG